MTFIKKIIRLFIPNTENRLLSLDFLRGVAIILVLGRHIPNKHLIFPSNINLIINQWIFIGWSGVDFFFVLSGFLVSGLLFNEYKKNNSINIKRFIIRRGFKIWPAYYIYIFLIICFYTLKHRDVNIFYGLETYWPALIHIQNYIVTPRHHLWSLSLEEHFYIGLSIFLFILVKYSKRFVINGIPILCISFLILIPVLRFLTDFDLQATHIRIDGLFWGVMLSYLFHFKNNIFIIICKYQKSCLLLGLLFLIPINFVTIESSIMMRSAGLSFVYIGYSLILLSFLSPNKSLNFLYTNIFGKIISFIGFYCYSIYLWHIDLAVIPIQKILIFFQIQDLSFFSSFMVLIIYLVLSVLCGVVLGRFIEIPMLAIRDKLFPSKNKSLTSID
jgi:peptidoglycan/LPS O-acetylase OafA/YrhL